MKSLKTTFENITKDNGFQSDILLVLRGIRDLKDFTGNFPGLALFKTANDVDEDYQGGSQDRLDLNIWGFTTVEARDNNYDNLDKLVADVEKILHSSTYNSDYYNNTFILDTKFYEGGVDDSFGFFDMHIQISYFHSLGDI